MGNPSEAQPMESKNQQATASLVLGIASIGLFFIIEVVGIVAGLLALVAGVRGLRIAKQIDGRGRILAFAGMSLGAVGLAVGGLTFVSGVRGPNQVLNRAVADATHAASLPSEAPQIYQGDGFTLRYQADWQIGDFSQNEACQQPDVECLLWLGHPSNDGTTILLIGSELSSEYDADNYYALMTAVNEAAHPDAILEGPELFEINGLPAVRVIFTVPGSSAGEEQQRLQVSVVRGLDHFLITAGAPSAETFENHQGEIEEIVASITFAP